MKLIPKNCSEKKWKKLKGQKGCLIIMIVQGGIGFVGCEIKVS